MILVIPAIDLLDEHCVRRRGEAFVREDEYFEDPVKMARLWRLQNARTLHVVGHDHGDQCRRTILRDICNAVDIPVQLAGGFQRLEDVESAFDAGAYRIVMDVALPRDLAFHSDLLDRFGPNRIAACIRARDGELLAGSAVSAVEIALDLERAGCRRIVYSDFVGSAEVAQLNVEALARLGRALSKARVTVSGGVNGYADLMRVCDQRDIGIDSVVIGRALYENRFPCQQFWCWHYMDELDLSRFTTARLTGKESAAL